MDWRVGPARAARGRGVTGVEVAERGCLNGRGRWCGRAEGGWRESERSARHLAEKTDASLSLPIAGGPFRNGAGDVDENLEGGERANVLLA